MIQMQYSTRHALPAITLLLAFATISAAAEIRLKPRAQTSGATVRLGDVADVYGDDQANVAKLRNVNLFPTPAPGERRKISLRQMQEVLQLQGVNLIKNRMSGASTIELIPAAAATVQTAAMRQPPAPLNTAARTRAQKKAEQSIRWFLTTYVDAEADWKVRVETSLDVLRSIDRNRHILVASSNQQVTADRQQWIGRRRFTLASPQEGTGIVLQVEAEVSLPELVVVASRSVRRGEILQESDLQLAAPPRTRLVEPAYHLEEVVGKELKRSLSPGQAVSGAALQSPRLVRRNEIVTVYVRAAGVQVRTMARALEEGGKGEVVRVQSLDASRIKHLARVTDFQVVEILAAGPAVVRPAQR